MAFAGAAQLQRIIQRVSSLRLRMLMRLRRQVAFISNPVPRRPQQQSHHKHIIMAMGDLLISCRYSCRYAAAVLFPGPVLHVLVMSPSFIFLAVGVARWAVVVSTGASVCRRCTQVSHIGT